MAGIGFELRKVISRGGLSHTFNAALSGIMIVAGPWLLTILTIFFIRQFFDASGIPNPGLFQSSVAYCYAISLSVFSMVHHLFTRMTADLIWVQAPRQASSWLIGFLVFTGAAAGGGSWVALSLLDLGGIENPGFFKVSVVILFTAINLIWVAMLFISLLKWYTQIMLTYLVGMGVSVYLVFIWGSIWGAPGAILGFGVGHLLIALILVVMSLTAFPPLAVKKPWDILTRYIGKFSLLIISGFFFYAGQWADKFFFWFTRGDGVEGTFFHRYDFYDIPVYWAGLSLIPGLIYFVIYSETAFYLSLQKFLSAVNRGTYKKIQCTKFLMIRTLYTEIRNQNLFQGLFTLGAGLLVYWFVKDQSFALVAYLALAGAFFQLLLMTVLNFLYYFEMYLEAFISAGLFFVLNGIIGPLVYNLWSFIPPGTGFLISASSAAILGFAFLHSGARAMDRRIFLRAVL